MGNVRLSYAKNPDTGSAEVLDRNDYYPFGMNMQGVSSSFDTVGAVYNHKYNQKELQETGFYDYGWRQYMPDLGRWFGMDQLSESYSSTSPYAYVMNNPAMMYDPDGRVSQDWLMSFYNNSPNGSNTTWTNMGGEFYSDNMNSSGETTSITSSGIVNFGIAPVIIQGQGSAGSWNSASNYAYNSAVLMGGISNAVGDFNREQTRSRYHALEDACSTCQDIKAFERFLFLELPINLAGGELLSVGWRAAGVGKMFAKTIGNLSESVAKTFQFGKYTEVVLKEPIILSRYYDNVNAFAKGRYMTDIISNPTIDRVGLAIKPEWNAMTKVASWEVPAGTTVFKGRAAMQFPWIGGKTQYFVPDLSNLVRVIP